MRATLFGVLSIVSLAVATPETARAENCAGVYDAAFARIRSSSSSGSNQMAADREVENLFGPRANKCEEGGYQHFLDGFEAFSREAIRAAQPQKVGKRVNPAPPGSDAMIRLAIAALRKAPNKVPAKEAKAAINGYRQVRSNLSAVVEDAGSTQPMNDLLNAMNQSRAPDSAEDGPPSGDTVTVTTTTTTAPTPSYTPPSTSPKTSSVTAVRVPSVAMPTWAIIKLYEARDAASLKDSEIAKAKLQDVIIWIESVTQGQ